MYGNNTRDTNHNLKSYRGLNMSALQKQLEAMKQIAKLDLIFLALEKNAKNARVALNKMDLEGLESYTNQLGKSLENLGDTTEALQKLGEIEDGK
jgi:hypothetical protein